METETDARLDMVMTPKMSMEDDVLLFEDNFVEDPLLSFNEFDVEENDNTNMLFEDSNAGVSDEVLVNVSNTDAAAEVMSLTTKEAGAS